MLQTILSRRYSGERKFSQNKRFPTVKGFTNRENIFTDFLPHGLLSSKIKYTVTCYNCYVFGIGLVKIDVK